jgi:nucleoside-diphosphate-sugar epimerase
MKSGEGPVLVVGASGFLGRAVVRALVDDGFVVRGLVRDMAKGERVRENGGIPYLGDILDATSLRAAAEGCAAAIHLAANPAREEEGRTVRVEGARQLIDVCRDGGVARLLIGSGYWVYGGQGTLLTEEAPVDPRGESLVNYDTERTGVAAQRPGQLDVLVLRPGMVYGDGSWFRGMATAIHRGEYSVVGEGANRWSFVARADAGRAFATVLRSGAGGETYNVVDGQPALLREFADFVAAQLGVARPPSRSPESASAEWGADVAYHLAADRPTSNAKVVALGWRPSLASYREGIPPLLREMFRHATTRSR